LAPSHPPRFPREGVVAICVQEPKREERRKEERKVRKEGRKGKEREGKEGLRRRKKTARQIKGVLSLSFTHQKSHAIRTKCRTVSDGEQEV